MFAAASGFCLPQGDKSYLATREEAHRQTGGTGAIARVADHPAAAPQPAGMPPAESAVREDGRAAGQTHLAAVGVAAEIDCISGGGGDRRGFRRMDQRNLETGWRAR